MNRLEKTLRDKKDAGSKILVPFLTGCYPDPETFSRLLLAMEDAGADAVEVGLPFSDPSADGPVLQAASMKALKAGATVRKIMKAVSEAREKGFGLPLVYMTYYNPVLAFGPSVFGSAAADSGADGLIVVDLPPEESDEFMPEARCAGLATIMLVAPTTPAARLPLILKNCGGFVYCVSVTGVTGVKKPAAATMAGMVDLLRPLTSLPVLAGFGIDGPEAAARMAESTDGVIVGSALTKAIGDLSGNDAAYAAGAFLKPLRRALA